MHHFNRSKLALASLLATTALAAQAQAYQFRVPVPVLHVTPNSTAAPAFSLSTAALDFGSVSAPATKSLSLVVANTGNVALATPVIGATGPGFSATHNCAPSLAVGASCAVTGTFAPANSGSYQGTLSIGYNGTPAQAATLAGSAAEYAILSEVYSDFLQITSAGTVATAGMGGAAGTGTGYATARANVGISAGKHYWEQTHNSGGPTGVSWYQFSCGIVPSGHLLTDIPGWGTPGYAFNLYTNIPFGTVHGCALDMDARTIAWYKNGVLQATVPVVPATYFPAVSGWKGDSYVVNFGQAPFAYPVPVGFTAGVLR